MDRALVHLLAVAARGGQPGGGQKAGRRVDRRCPADRTNGRSALGDDVGAVGRQGGARDDNRRALEQSRGRTVRALETYLDGRSGYLFGDEPTAADFGLFGPLEQYRRDPTGRRRLEDTPHLRSYLDRLDRMRLPHPVVARRGGDVEDLSGLQPVVAEAFGTYLEVLVAQAQAHSSQASASSIRAELVDGTAFEMSASRYLARRVDFVVEQLETVADNGGRLASRGLEIGKAAAEMARRLRAARG